MTEEDLKNLPIDFINISREIGLCTKKKKVRAKRNTEWVSRWRRRQCYRVAEVGLQRHRKGETQREGKKKNLIRGGQLKKDEATFTRATCEKKKKGKKDRRRAASTSGKKKKEPLKTKSTEEEVSRTERYGRQSRDRRSIDMKK